jgi:hypothetical protein
MHPQRIFGDSRSAFLIGYSTFITSNAMKREQTLKPFAKLSVLCVFAVKKNYDPVSTVNNLATYNDTKLKNTAIAPTIKKVHGSLFTVHGSAG